MGKIVTSLDEIRAQVEPEVIEIPGFKTGTVINVKVRGIDVTPNLLRLRVANPFLTEAQKMAQGGATKEEIAASFNSDSLLEMLPILDEVVREALIEPTYDEISAIRPLTLAQKLAIFAYLTGEPIAAPFRE